MAIPAMEEAVTATPVKAPPVDGAVLFFDGVCNLCNTTVDTLLRMDSGNHPVRLKFASLQSPQARSALEARGLKPETYISPKDTKDETVVYFAPTGQVIPRTRRCVGVRPCKLTTSRARCRFTCALPRFCVQRRRLRPCGCM